MAGNVETVTADGGYGRIRARRLRSAGLAALAVVLVLGLPGTGQADSIAEGKEKVRTKGCVTCHDAKGQGTSPMFPNLAGQSEVYLEQQLKAFRSGERQAPQMSIMAQDLSNDDISDLAAYYASLSPCACAQ